jgi:hypothetical protein
MRRGCSAISSMDSSDTASSFWSCSPLHDRRGVGRESAGGKGSLSLPPPWSWPGSFSPGRAASREARRTDGAAKGFLLALLARVLAVSMALVGIIAAVIVLRRGPARVRRWAIGSLAVATTITVFGTLMVLLDGLVAR